MGSGERTRLVLVDDHLSYLEALAESLKHRYDSDIVGLCSDAKSAVQVIASARPDVAVVDYATQTGRDGPTIADEVRRRTPSVRVLLLTGYLGDQQKLGAALRAGCSGYVEKSAPLRDLAEAIRTIARGGNLWPSDLLEQVLAQANAAAPSREQRLSPRELEVLNLLAEGQTTRQLGERLSLSPNTARNHVQAVLKKLDVHTRGEAVSVARRQMLLTDRPGSAPPPPPQSG